MFVFSVECDLHGNRDVSVFNLVYPTGFTQCLALGKGSLYICKINCWMNVAIRSLLAKVQEAVNYSEERGELGAKKFRFAFCRYHHPPYASLLPPLRWASPWSHYDAENFDFWKEEKCRRGYGLCWYSWWVYVQALPPYWWPWECHLTFLHFQPFLNNKGNTSLLKEGCEHRIKYMCEELGLFASTANIRGQVGLEDGNGLWSFTFPTSTVWFGNGSLQ